MLSGREAVTRLALADDLAWGTARHADTESLRSHGSGSECGTALTHIERPHQRPRLESGAEAAPGFASTPAMVRLGPARGEQPCPI